MGWGHALEPCTPFSEPLSSPTALVAVEEAAAAAAASTYTSHTNNPPPSAPPQHPAAGSSTAHTLPCTAAPHPPSRSHQGSYPLAHPATNFRTHSPQPETPAAWSQRW